MQRTFHYFLSKVVGSVAQQIDYVRDSELLFMTLCPIMPPLETLTDYVLVLIFRQYNNAFLRVIRINIRSGSELSVSKSEWMA